MGKYSNGVRISQYEAAKKRDELEKNPIDERKYSKELFSMGREQALFDCGRITEEQRMYLETSYPGDIKNSVNYLRGYQRGIEISKTSHLPDEYKKNKLHR